MKTSPIITAGNPWRRALGLAFALLLSTSSAAETVRIRADSWMPMNGDPVAEKPGYVVEILRAICAENGLELDYALMPWDDSLTAARGARIDGVIGAGAAEAEGLVLPSEPIGTARVSLWLRRDQVWAYRGVASLAGLRLGVNEGYAYWSELDAYIKASTAPQVIAFSGDAPLSEMIRKLRDGALDVVPETEAVFVWNVREQGFAPEDFRAEYTHTGDPIYVAFAAGEQGRRLAALFDAGILRLRESGELRRILERYGLKRL